MNKILITGATGFLGSKVVQRLAAAGAPLILATHRAPLAVEGESLALNLEADVVLPAGIDTVIHIAGEKRDEAQMLEVNGMGTLRLVMAASKAGVRRFVYVSSVGSYGAAPGSGNVTEDFPCTPQNRYEMSKYHGEREVRAIGSAAGMERVILQPSNVIGLGKSNPLLGMMRMVAKRRFAWVGRTDPIVNYVSVDDVAAAIVAAGVGTVTGTYIVNTPCRLVDLVGWVADELKVPAPTLRLPGWLGRALVRRPLPLSPEKLRELTNTTRYAPEAFMLAAGFEYPIGVERLVRELARHYRAEGLL
jgi:nucleoside-diphosphate-sugar epimerase